MPLLTLADFERTALDTLMEFGAIPALSPQFDPAWAETGHLERAAQLLADWARRRALARHTVEIVRLPGRTPTLVVTVEPTGPSGGTVVLYGHLDKQPPLGDWSEGLGPWSPVRRGDRLYARGVSDDGYAAFAALSALEALEAAGVAHGRCVVLIEASEESGSPDLEAYLDHLAAHLGEVELLVCLDSGAVSYDRLWVTTSLRGNVNVEVTVAVLSQGQHSGSTSGVVPSSFRVLRQLLDRLEDAETGRVLLDELHAPIPAEHRDAARVLAAEFGDVAAQGLPLLEGVRVMGADAEDRILNKTWRPTLSTIGMAGIPAPADAGNVLRPYTTATLSFRLPPTVAAEGALAAIERALTTDVPSGAHVRVVPQHPGDGWVAPTFAPWLREALEAASRDAFGQPLGYTGEGGSIPFLGSLARRYPGVQFVATGVGGPGANAHAIDEMLDLPTAVGVANAVTTVVAAHAAR